MLEVSEPERLRALGDDVRGRIVTLLRERAMSTAQLAVALELPKGTVSHHVKVLERAKLIHVVRTRQVRAVTEKYYGRVARMFLFKSDGDPAAVENLAAAAVRNAAHELERANELRAFTSMHVRLNDHDAQRFERRLKKLVNDFSLRDDEDGVRLGFVTALYERSDT